MNDANSQRLLQHIRRLAGDPPGAPSDSELLRRYLERRDESAFAALVRRHGPMVFAVCQSVLRQRHDAEDAFQAAFLILARKADAVRRHEGIGGWLQRVAYRVALKARADNLRRRQREVKVARSAAEEPSSDDLSWGELRTILHRELAALPESLRAPLVLCYLEGRTQEEAARQLGWPLSTVRGRLQRGREKLRRRLERRGVALTAALGAALTGQTLAETAVPSLTAAATATALAHAFLRPLLPIKLAILSAVLLSLGVVAGGMVLLSSSEPRPSESGDPDRSLTVAAPKEAVNAHGDPLPEGAIARLGTVRFNHGDGLRTLLFSPDGKTILSRGERGACLWDAATGAEIVRCTSSQPEWVVPEVAIRPDGKTMVSLHQDQRGDIVREWDFATQKELRTQTLPMRRDSVDIFRRNALTPDGRLAALNTSTELRVFDLIAGRELFKLARGGKEIQDVVFAGNHQLVTADSKQIIDVWAARTGKLIRRFSNDAPAGFLAASDDGRWLAILEHHTHQPTFSRRPDKDGIHVWDLAAGAKKHTLAAPLKQRFRTGHFFAGGKRLLTSSLSPQGKELTVWDVETGERLRKMKSDVRSSPPAIAINAAGDCLAVGDIMGKIEMWDLTTGRCLSGENNRHTWAATVFLSPAGNRVYTIGYHSFSTWDAQTGRRLESIEVPRSNDWNTPRRSFSPDGRYAVSYTGDGKEFQVLIWDVAARRQLHSLPLPSKEDYVYLDGVFSPDSTLLAIWQPLNYAPRSGMETEAIIHIWDLRTSKEIRSFKEDKSGWPGQVSFSADGKTLLVAGTKHIVGFDVANGKELFSWHMKPLPDTSGSVIAVNGKPLDPNERCAWRALAVSPHGSLIACILDGGSLRQAAPERIALFDARTGKLLRRWSDSGKPTISNYERMAFSADGQLLASSDGYDIHLWEVATGKEIRAFRGHRSEIAALTFSSDGRRLASTSWDSTVLIWDTTGKSLKPQTDASAEQYWKALLAEEAATAHEAVWALAHAPQQSLPFLKARLHPVKPVSREQLDRLIADLDSEQFPVREKATAELENLGELAEPALRRVLENKPTLEQRRRIEPILAKLDAAIPSGDTLRSLRSVPVLEHIATPEARQLLRELANGAEGALLTRAAQAALARLNRRAP